MNPNIALSFQRPRFDPGEGQRNALAMRGAQMQEAANLMTMQNSMEDRQFQTQQRNALAGVDPKSENYFDQLAGIYEQSGDIEKALAIRSQKATMDKNTFDQKNAELGALMKITPLLQKPETWGQGREIARQLAPSFYAQMPEQFDEGFAGGYNSMAIGAKGTAELAQGERRLQQGSYGTEVPYPPAVAAQRLARSAAGASSVNVNNIPKPPPGFAWDPSGTNLAAIPGGPEDPSVKRSPAQTKVDQEVATNYAADVAGGGLADTEKNLAQLDEVLTAMETGQGLTGPWVSMIPNAVRSRTNPEAIDAQELVEDVVQRNLRIILGAQFTEKEGERLISRAYNPRLPEELNAARLRRLRDAMEAGLEAKKASYAYYEENGTMRGYKGPVVSVNDFYAAIKGGEETKKPTRPGRGGSKPKDQGMKFLGFE